MWFDLAAYKMTEPEKQKKIQGYFTK